jgi:CysZ protein
MMIPGILSLLYVLILLIVGAVYFSDISAYITQRWLPDFMKSGIMRVVTSIMLWIFLLLTGYITYKPVIMILFSPMLGYLSEVVEKSVYNSAIPDFDFKEMLRLAVRGLYLNLRNLAFMIILSLMAWLLVLIPLLGMLISPILLALIQFYYDGFGLMDYTLERKGLSARDSIRFAKSHRAAVMGVGSGFMFLMMIPFLGWFTAPSYGTVAATLAALEMTEQK